MNDQEKRFGIHKKYGIDISKSNQTRKPQYYRLVGYGNGQEIVYAQVYPSQYAILVAKKKEMLKNRLYHYYSIKNSGYKLVIEPVF